MIDTKLFLNKTAKSFAPIGNAEVHDVGNDCCNLVLGCGTPREITIRIDCRSPLFAVSSIGRWLAETNADKLASHWIISGAGDMTDALEVYRFALDTVARVFGILVALSCFCGNSFTWTGSGYLISFIHRDGKLLGMSVSMQMPNSDFKCSEAGVDLPEYDEGFVFTIEQFAKEIKVAHDKFDENDFVERVVRDSFGKVDVPTAFATSVAFERFLSAVALGLAVAAKYN